MQNFLVQLQVAALILLLLLLLHQNGGRCNQFQVGDLNFWGLPPPSAPFLYSSWSQRHHFRPGDSLLFLYPPSHDSVIQVTERAFNICNIEDPIAELPDENGYSLFNLTAPLRYYFTSGVAGRCRKEQKLAITVASASITSGSGRSFFPPAAALPDSPAESRSSSYTFVFGPAGAPAEAPSGGAPEAGVAVHSTVVVVIVAAAAALLLGLGRDLALDL